MKAAAKRRLDAAADVLVQRLLGFALDGDVRSAPRWSKPPGYR